MQPVEFLNKKLKENHVAIYLQSADSPVVKRALKKKSRLYKEKGEDHLPPAGRKYSEDEVYGTALSTIIGLFKKGSGRNWPFLEVGKVSATNPQEGEVQIMEPLIQVSDNSLNLNYFSIPYCQNDLSKSTFLNILKKLPFGPEITLYKKR